MIKLTEKAKEYLKRIGDPNVSLTVKGGGCAGFQYEWGITDKDPTVENLWAAPHHRTIYPQLLDDIPHDTGGNCKGQSNGTT